MDHNGGGKMRKLIAAMMASLFLLLLAISMVSASSALQGGTDYTVQLDDNLWAIAEKFLGDGDQYGDIVTATNARHTEDPSYAFIENPRLILPGWKLAIPGLAATPSPSAPTAAPPPQPTVPPSATVPAGKIAFSFWNLGREVYEIQIIHADGTGGYILTEDSVSEPAFSPDGQRIAFRSWEGHRGIAHRNLDGRDQQVVSYNHEDSWPDWSPDGQYIVYASQKEADRTWRLYVADALGHENQVLKHKDGQVVYGEDPAWSPDGSKIVYRGHDARMDNRGLYVINNDGSNARQLTDDPSDTSPDWSPRGDQVVFMSHRNGNWDLYVMRGDGSGLKPLTTDTSNEGLPCWSPDGDRIAFISDRGGQWGLYTMAADGGDIQLVHLIDGTYTPSAWSNYDAERGLASEQISWSR
jgi:Tol biopolymer transport system component